MERVRSIQLTQHRLNSLHIRAQPRGRAPNVDGTVLFVTGVRLLR